MNADSELLRRFVDEKSESAFTELVQRHVGLVYSVALRRVGGDAHLAEDVAQKVFADLARKAIGLRDRPTLGGWLYASSHLASAAVVRSERRRKERESAAHFMQETLSSSDHDPDWARLRPVIDDVVVALKDDDREAIALRFFEKRSFAEIGLALRVTEEAARKRVDRALEKLRALLARRGITSTDVALGFALGAIGAATAPTALAGKVATGALMNVSAGTSTLATIAGAVWPAAAVICLGSALLTWQSNLNQTLRSEVGRATADNAALSRLRSENVRLARDVASMAVPTVRAPSMMTAAPADVEPAPRRIAANITLNPNGTIAWNSDYVSLAEFVAQLRRLQARGDSESRIHISAVGTEFSALTYVIDEVRKAGLNHITVESTAKPDLNRPPVSFWF
jgi:RNA polymerase sigma factor (sigma-70 family)